MDDAALGGEVRVSAAGECGAARAARGVLRKGNAYFEVGADGDVEMRHEGGSVAAKIFAGSVFFAGDPGLGAAGGRRFYVPSVASIRWRWEGPWAGSSILVTRSGSASSCAVTRPSKKRSTLSRISVGVRAACTIARSSPPFPTP